MSGESKPQTGPPVGDPERAFGERARCNRCGATTSGYRAIASFFGATVALRAYCAGCYPVAVAGDYFAAGDGEVLDLAAFAARFGGPAIQVETPVARRLAVLVRDPALRALVPGSETEARRRGPPPHRFRVVLQLDDRPDEAEFVLDGDGTLRTLAGDPEVSARVRRMLGTISPR